MYEDPLFPYVKLKSNFITFNCVCLAISLSAIDQKSKHTNWAHIQRKSWKYCALIWSPFRRFKHQEFRLRSLFTQSQQNLKNAIEWAFVLLNSNHGSTYIFTLLHYQPVSQTKTIYDEVITSRNKIPVKKSEANEKQTKNESKAAPRRNWLAVFTIKEKLCSKNNLNCSNMKHYENSKQRFCHRTPTCNLLCAQQL